MYINTIATNYSYSPEILVYYPFSMGGHVVFIPPSLTTFTPLVSHPPWCRLKVPRPSTMIYAPSTPYTHLVKGRYTSVVSDLINVATSTSLPLISPTASTGMTMAFDVATTLMIPLP